MIHTTTSHPTLRMRKWPRRRRFHRRMTKSTPKSSAAWTFPRTSATRRSTRTRHSPPRIRRSSPGSSRRRTKRLRLPQRRWPLPQRRLHRLRKPPLQRRSRRPKSPPRRRLPPRKPRRRSPVRSVRLRSPSPRGDRRVRRSDSFRLVVRDARLSMTKI